MNKRKCLLNQPSSTPNNSKKKRAADATDEKTGVDTITPNKNTLENLDSPPAEVTPPALAQLPSLRALVQIDYLSNLSRTDLVTMIGDLVKRDIWPLAKFSCRPNSPEELSLMRFAQKRLGYNGCTQHFCIEIWPEVKKTIHSKIRCYRSYIIHSMKNRYLGKDCRHTCFSFFSPTSPLLFIALQNPWLLGETRRSPIGPFSQGLTWSVSIRQML